MKIRVFVSSLTSSLARKHFRVKTHARFAHSVLCSDFTPRALKKFTFCVITALHWILRLPGNGCRKAR